MSKLRPHKQLERIENLLTKLDELYELESFGSPEESSAIKQRWEEHAAYVFALQARVNMLRVA